MKNIIILFCFCLFAGITRAKDPHFQIVFSKPLAVFEFLDNLSANAPANSFKSLFDSSSFNQEKYRALIKQYDQLNIDFGYEYEKYPYAQKIGGSTRSLLKRNLLNCHGIPEFRMSSLGIVPNRDLFSLASILQDFEPVYEQLVYQPNKLRFELQLEALKNKINSQHIASYFKTGLIFYHSSWDESLPFILAFYPLPNSKGFTATAFYNNAESGIPTSWTDYNKLLAVMLHEIFHILYDEESLEFKTNIKKSFEASASKNSRYAYLLLNESLATALGNGYVYGKLRGKEDTAYWYRRKYTNLMAKQIYPLVQTYIDRKIPIDESFINAYIKIYDDHFSDWLREADNILTDRYVLSDHADDFQVVDSEFPYRSMSQYEVGVSESSLDKLKQAPITKLVIISKENNNKLLLVKKKFMELQDWQPLDQEDFTYCLFLADKTYLIIINQVRKTTREQLADLKIPSP
jgi:hypothetical protein